MPHELAETAQGWVIRRPGHYRDSLLGGWNSPRLVRRLKQLR